jgi:hypothetical protein
VADGANDISRYEGEVGPARIAVVRGSFRKANTPPLSLTSTPERLRAAANPSIRLIEPGLAQPEAPKNWIVTFRPSLAQ